MECDKILLETQPEYDFVKNRGFEPLLPNKHFRLGIKLRVQLQRKLFGHCTTGRGDVMAANDRFFRWIWDNKPHYCEECMKPLREYSAVYCSHILSRGAHPDMAWDARNINILCHRHHEQWEDNTQRHKMRIYEKNQQIIKELQADYGKRDMERY